MLLLGDVVPWWRSNHNIPKTYGGLVPCKVEGFHVQFNNNMLIRAHFVYATCNTLSSITHFSLILVIDHAV